MQPTIQARRTVVGEHRASIKAAVTVPCESRRFRPIARRLTSKSARLQTIVGAARNLWHPRASTRPAGIDDATHAPAATGAGEHNGRVGHTARPGCRPYRWLATPRRASAAALLARKGARDTPVSYPELSGPYLGQPEPGPQPRLIAPCVVSSEEHDTNVIFTPDGRELRRSCINAKQTRRWLLVMCVKRVRAGGRPAANRASMLS